MVAHLQLRASQYYFDASGYYSYVLLNGSQALCQAVQRLLTQNGFEVILAGPSYRPASNGRQYQWYIRIVHSSGGRPFPNAVRQILASDGTPAVQDSGTSRPVMDVEDEQYPEQNEDWGTSEPFMDVEEPQASDLKEIIALKAAITEEQHKNAAAVERIESLSTQNKKLQDAYKKAQKELQAGRDRMSALELQLAKPSQVPPAADDRDGIRKGYEDKIQTLSENLEVANETIRTQAKDNASWIATFEPEVRAKSEIIDILRGQIVERDSHIDRLEFEKGTLASQAVDERVPQQSTPDKGSFEFILSEMFARLLPRVELFPGSREILWREIKNPLRVVDKLRSLEHLNGTLIESAKGWREGPHVDKWRFYYKKCNEGPYQVMISHKDHQKRDFARLKKH